MDRYFKGLKVGIDEAYEIAKQARSQGHDPDWEVEAIPAGDLADRVEGRVGPKGIAKKIREIGRKRLPEIIDSILDGEFEVPEDERILQALRTSMDILTEGVVAASVEGISDVKTETNPDGSRYISIYFAGPIRSAGGTAQGVAVLIGDYIRKKRGLQEYRPTADEVERYVEEIKLYNDRISRLQYLPSEDDIRTIVKNNPVCVNGDPTERLEVPIHRDLKRVESNRIRGGMCLVIGEGIAQKARKIKDHARRMGLDWEWLSEIGRKKTAEDADELDKPSARFMDEIVGGRPIFAAPSAKGAFRLRYGRSRCSGIAGKSMSPATMILLDGFIATGTQVKVEKPGKGCIITECDQIEGPIVRLKNGSVVRVDNAIQAWDVKANLSEILFLGDILVSYGDFLQTNTNLLPAGYCEEWWSQEVEGNGGKVNGVPSLKEAIDISKKYNVPLHPRYTHRWEDINVDELKNLIAWILSGDIGDALTLGRNAIGKKILEKLGVPHDVREDSIIIPEYLALLVPLRLLDEGKLSDEMIKQVIGRYEPKDNAFEFVKEISQIKIRKKVGTYIGCRMGRPEKAKERRMQPAVHSLFPIGEAGGRERSVNVAAQQKSIRVDLVKYQCPKCQNVTIKPICPDCGTKTVSRRICPACKVAVDKEQCPRCDTRTRFFEKRDLNIGDLWEKAIAKVGRASKVKGVKGMISKYKVPEPLEKGILRANNDVFVFKDGTIRFDATDAPLTHFRPREINISVEKLKQLGYELDHEGKPITSEDQIVKLEVQDVVLPMSGAKYMLKVARFIDQLLEKLYGLKPYYNATGIDDLLGHLLVGLAPHTSAGIIGRVVGFAKVNVCYAHPYWHTAKRRNCDGDEDSVMLLMDVLLNFSRKYLPEKRGGQMDAPLVVTTFLDPKEIDDEAHKMEIVDSYPIKFYDATWAATSPSKVEVRTVSDILDKDPYGDLNFTHDTGNIRGPFQKSQYVKLETMADKVKAQLKVAERSRAIDEKVVAELVINSHFLRDTYGNLRAFARQRFRCVKCNANYRRVPMVGKCTKCGGKLLLTVTEGNIRKYLQTSMTIADKYGLSDYLKQRLGILDTEITSLFTNDLAKQASLSDFM